MGSPYSNQGQEHDIQKILQTTNKEIQLAKYKISRVVDDGSHHIVLENRVMREFNILDEIPILCRITLKGMEPPLTITLIQTAKSDLTIYGSYKS